MPEEFHYKHIHSVVWLIIILLVVIIIAGFLVVQLTDNAPVGEVIPEVTVTPVDTTKQIDDSQPDTVVTTSNNSGQDGTEAGKAIMKTAEVVQQGDDVSVMVMMDTDNKNINVAKVTLIYDPAMLRYESFDKTGTVLPMEFRNEPSAGMIVISRGAPGDTNPNDNDDGYTGSDGLFGSFQFTALKVGKAEVSLGWQGTIYYLDDGLGSKIYPAVDKLNITIN